MHHSIFYDETRPNPLQFNLTRAFWALKFFDEKLSREKLF